MKKTLIAVLALSAVGMTACGGGTTDDTDVVVDGGASNGGETVLDFNCPTDWPACSVNDPDTGNVDFVINAMTGVGGNTMGPLVTADAMADASTKDQAWGKVAQQFQISPADATDSGSSAAGNDYIVFDSKLNPGQMTYAEVMQKDNSFFSCQVSGPFESAEEAKTQGEDACSNMQ